VSVLEGLCNSVVKGKNGSGIDVSGYRMPWSLTLTVTLGTRPELVDCSKPLSRVEFYWPNPFFYALEISRLHSLFAKNVERG
jgi:hypothetical protein